MKIDKIAVLFLFLLCNVIAFCSQGGNQDDPNYPNFLAIEQFYRFPHEGIEKSNIVPDFFMDVELHLNDDIESKTLYLQHVDYEYSVTYAPLAMSAAYHLCKEITRVGAFLIEHWHTSDKDRGKNYRVNFKVKPFTAFKGYLGYHYCVFASAKSKIMAEKFCAWADCFLQANNWSIASCPTPGIFENDEFKREGVSLGTPLFIGHVLPSSQNDREQEARKLKRKEAAQQLAAEDNHSHLKYIFFRMTGASLLFLIIMSYLTHK